MQAADSDTKGLDRGLCVAEGTILETVSATTSSATRYVALDVFGSRLGFLRCLVDFLSHKFRDLLVLLSIAVN